MIRIIKRSIFTILGAVTLNAAALAAFPLATGAQAPVPVAPAARAVTLRFKFTPGQVHRYKLSASAVSTMSGLPEADTPTTTTVQIVVKQTVNSVRASDGAATITTSIESMRLTADGKNRPIPAAHLAALKRATIEVMLPTGKVLSVKKPGTPATINPGTNSSTSLGSMISAAFPDGPLKAGDTWKDTVPVPESKGSTLTLHSTLASLTGDGDAARANINQKISGPMLIDPSQGATPDLKVAATVNETITIVFNTAQGLVQSLTSDTSVDMTFNTKPGQAPPSKKPAGIKMRLHRKTTMELLPDVAAAPIK